MNEQSRTMVIEFTQEGGYAGNIIMARMFEEGWETLEPLKWFTCCKYYRTVLYLPRNAKVPQITEQK
jgi:hypothetical protein